MRNSLARSLFTCRAQLSHACEKPWMKRISGPFGLPHSCAEIVNPSGVFTIKGLYLGVGCASAALAATTVKSAATAFMAPPRVSCVRQSTPARRTHGSREDPALGRKRAPEEPRL